MKLPVVPSVICVHDDAAFLGQAIQSFLPAGPVTVLVSRVPWHGEPGNWQESAKIAREAGAEVIEGEWRSELAHRIAVHELMKSRKQRYIFIPDSDEVISPELLAACQRQAAAQTASIVRVRMDTYWKSPQFVIRPREGLAPVLMLDVRETTPVRLREFEGAPQLLLEADHGVLHHLSYVGDDERIGRKIETWGHRDELVEGWFERVWQGWDSDRMMTHLHPTHPPAYEWIERIPVPEPLASVRDSWPVPSPPSKPKSWPKVSVVIPLHGGEEDIYLCLESLSKLKDLVHETIVCDDASPDDAMTVVKKFTGVKTLRSTEAKGFAQTCNAGAKVAKGDIVLFLNSDTIVPRAGLIELISALQVSGSIGAAGPMSNAAAYHQGTAGRYTSLANIDAFAIDFAQGKQEDEDVPILVGFCLAVRKSVLDEVGLFDDRFGLGFFEDNDLSYRILRAGYRLRLATRAFVHHKGSSSMRRTQINTEALLRTNRTKFQWKWFDDVHAGYASALSGDDRRLIHFDPSRKPERIAQECRARRDKCGVCLTIIVKDEERVLADCLRSAVPYFSQVVVVDTGSSDRTQEIARSFGVEVIQSSWKDSFATARNESLAAARQPWVLWIDADDVLPIKTVEQIQLAAMTAHDDIAGFVVPVQFTDQGPQGGTKVDHLKLFRNLPGLSWEGRIHEQIVPSIRALGGQIGRLDGVVLHANYDNSEEGQAKKRLRDMPLLQLDIQDRPEHPFPQFNMGMTLYHVGRHADALPYLIRSIQLAGPQDSHIRKSYALWAASLLQMGEREKAIHVMNEGLAVVPNDPELLFMRGKFHMQEGRREEALADIVAIRQDSDGFRSVDVSMFTVGRDEILRALLT